MFKVVTQKRWKMMLLKNELQNEVIQMHVKMGLEFLASATEEVSRLELDLLWAGRDWE